MISDTYWSWHAVTQVQLVWGEVALAAANIRRGVRDAWHIQNGWILGKLGVIFNPKNYIADFCHYRQYFGQEFRKNLQYDFLKVRGDAKAVWNFSENSSVLEEVGIPKPAFEWIRPVSAPGFPPDLSRLTAGPYFRVGKCFDTVLDEH